MADGSDYGFRIRPEGDAWRWSALNDQGEEVAGGDAPTKALAAALVIRTLARKAAPAGAD